MAFLSGYFSVPDDTDTEQPVCCPFPHHIGGVVHYEQNPSAHVNTSKGLFHCKVCGKGHNEKSFIQEVLGTSPQIAARLQQAFKTEEDWEDTESEGEFPDWLPDGVVQELQLKMRLDGAVLFPVILYNTLLDVRRYLPTSQYKLMSRKGSIAGLIIPFDVWRNSPKSRVTLLCAGEKDMCAARAHGFNAITITGGEAMPPRILSEFKNRTVCIVYDNDMAGHDGAIKVASTLYGHCASVKVVTGFHEVCTEDGEDIHDFFYKYRKSRQDLIAYLNAAPEFVPQADMPQQQYPLVDLLTASSAGYVNKLVQSNIQVVATNDASFLSPAVMLATKFKIMAADDKMQEGETKDWTLTPQNSEDLLHLVDNNFKEDTIRENMRMLLRVPFKEKGVKIETLASETIHKAYVTDLFEAAVTDAIPMEYTAYTIGCKLESGKKYLVTYKLIPHPYKGRQLTMVITAAVQAQDSVSNFRVTPEVIEQLQIFQTLPGSVPEKVATLTQSVKGMLGYDGNDTLIQAIDLSWHTVLEFNFGTFQNVRGYLDTLVVGESRMGKSSTAVALRDMYGLGVFTSLAGNAATIPGLVGGSNKVANSFQTRAGLIPQNHKGLIVFEEFGKSQNNIITELTDIRSSNEVRITRVSGSITMPAIVRMITLTNVKSSSGAIRPIASYPNGIEVVTELVGTAEDIARYDILLVLADKGATAIDPFWVPQPPLPQEAYRARVRWVWSRTAGQIEIPRDVGVYLVEQANELNKEYDSHIKIFGTEAWKKLARLAVAVAGYLVSTDESYTKIIVTREHVDFAKEFYVQIYDNEVFNLRKYVNDERAYSQEGEHDLERLQNVYNKTPSLVQQLATVSRATRSMLAAAAGLTNDELNRMLTMLSSAKLVRLIGYDVLPSEKFRRVFNKLRKTQPKKVGDCE